VRIPDCPGAFGAGQTAEQAISDAVAGLAAWAAATLKDGGIAVMIPLRLDAGRTVRANLTLDAGLIAVIDVEASRRGLTRSAFMAVRRGTGSGRFDARKVFLFEKKKQKTFAPAPSSIGAYAVQLARNQTSKSFLLRFFKK